MIKAAEYARLRGEDWTLGFGAGVSAAKKVGVRPFRALLGFQSFAYVLGGMGLGLEGSGPGVQWMLASANCV